ncbi:hypothetical protein NQ317_005561 [Molorchus minor]|uniref:Uncharacterized protein n=1 Tax=Molorchus minor TaxID=1323400 RepID=A0ABQ9IWB9_9CUCU|nr:hypothetical protein NQ317_005561 [Molorchus minor]
MYIQIFTKTTFKIPFVHLSIIYMAKNLLFLSLLISLSVIEGFPERPQKNNEQQRNPGRSPISSGPATVDFQKKDTGGPRSRPARDTESESRVGTEDHSSKISSLPATVDFKKQDTQQHQNDQNRKTRDTNNDESKPVDRSQISTLPATVDFKKTDTVLPKGNDNTTDKDQVRTAREAENDDSSPEDSSQGKDDESGEKTRVEKKIKKIQKNQFSVKEGICMRMNAVAPQSTSLAQILPETQPRIVQNHMMIITVQKAI